MKVAIIAANGRLFDAYKVFGVPQIEIDGQWILGFDPETVMNLWNRYEGGV